MAIILPDARQLSDEVLDALRLRVLNGRELGSTETDLADLLGISRETVCRWWSAYTAHGIDALPHHRTGRPLGTGRLISDEQARRVQRLLDETPRLASRVVEWLFEAHQHLAQALAARRGLPPDDLSSAASAWLAIFVLQRVDQAVQSGDERDGVAIASEIMAGLTTSAPLTPRL